VPERWPNTFEENIRLAQMADAAGLECLVPIGRWKGYGGATNFEGSTFETLTWACGLLAARPSLKHDLVMVTANVHHFGGFQGYQSRAGGLEVGAATHHERLLSSPKPPRSKVRSGRRQSRHIFCGSQDR